MKRLAIAAVMMVSIMATAYSCASKCVTVPPPGGYSYDEPTGQTENGAKK